MGDAKTLTWEGAFIHLSLERSWKFFIGLLFGLFVLLYLHLVDKFISSVDSSELLPVFAALST